MEIESNSEQFHIATLKELMEVKTRLALVRQERDSALKRCEVLHERVETVDRELNKARDEFEKKVELDARLAQQEIENLNQTAQRNILRLQGVEDERDNFRKLLHDANTRIAAQEKQISELIQSNRDATILPQARSGENQKTHCWTCHQPRRVFADASVCTETSDSGARPLLKQGAGPASGPAHLRRRSQPRRSPLSLPQEGLQS
ncbi:hypothetical protein F5I97DRAFT_1573651 [Phlebopus sp. FC_14]|nr:hypothetical protein F5I97DRAFT_1573651 [Phlebopus sp. FC_14]